MSFSSVTDDQNATVDDRIIKPQKIVEKSYETHAPIQIDNNTHFADLATVEGWLGEGSSDTPYVISGYNITTHTAHCIFIQNVDAYFEIRDCHFEGVLLGTYYGVYLYNCENGLIENTTFVHKQYGIQVEESSSITVNNCTLYDSGGRTIRFEDSDYCHVTSCHVIGGLKGIHFASMFYSTVDNCIVENVVNEGVYFQVAYYCTLSNTEVTACGNDRISSAIRLLQASHTTILNVTSHDNPSTSVCGLRADASHYSTISNSTFYRNDDYGIDLEDCNEVTLDNVNCSFNEYFGIYTYNANQTTIMESVIHENNYDGLFLHYSYYCNVSNNDFWENGGADCEITLVHSPYVTIFGNTLIGNRDNQGLYASYSHHANITANTIANNFDDGLNIQNSNYTHLEKNNISYNGGSGLFLWECDYSTIIDNTIVGNDDMGVYITASILCTLNDNEISNNRLDGVYTKDAHNLIMEFNEIFGNGWINYISNPRSGVYISTSDNCLLYLNTIYNNTVHGVYVSDSDGCVLNTNTIYGNLGMSSPGCGVYLDTSHDTTIMNSIIHHNIDDGIFGFYSDDCLISNNNIYSNAESGIDTLHCTSWIIHGNIIWNSSSSFGIHAQSCFDFVIDTNELYENDLGGIRLYLSDYNNFTNNLVHHNSVVGVMIDTSEGNLIRDNIIYDNYHNGLYLMYSNATWVYYNDFVLNDNRDAIEQDSTGSNYWDDNVSMGNWWWGIPYDLDDYLIYNETMYQTNVDRYPLSSMWIQGADTSIDYEFTSTGNTATWDAYAHNPGYYEVYSNGTLLRSELWYGGTIIVNLDGLGVGFHEIELVVYHLTGHNLTATGDVTVEDTTAPNWVTIPGDQTIYYGDSLSYQVNAADPSGLGIWAVNDTRFTIVDGLITNTSTLEVGDYGLLITVQDIYGNELSIEITIHVLPETTPTTPPPDIVTMAIIVLGMSGVVIVVIIVIVISKKKTS